MLAVEILSRYGCKMEEGSVQIQKDWGWGVHGVDHNVDIIHDHSRFSLCPLNPKCSKKLSRSVGLRAKNNSGDTAHAGGIDGASSSSRKTCSQVISLARFLPAFDDVAHCMKGYTYMCRL